MNLFKNKKRLAIILVVLAIAGMLTYALRGPDISNALKKIILPELELITGKQFTAQKIYINIFPLFAEMKNVKAVDSNGDLILSADRVKAYIGFSQIFKRTITIRKLFVFNPDINASDRQITDIYKKVEEYLASEPVSPIKVKIRRVDLVNAQIKTSSAILDATATGLNLTAHLRDTPRIILNSRNTLIQKKGADPVSFGIYADGMINNNLVELRKFNILSDVSAIQSKGSLDADTLSGRLQIEIKLALSTLKNMLGLKSRSEGEVRASGSIKTKDVRSLDDFMKRAELDFRVDGDFYLETLMESLKVTEPLHGYISFDGTVKGNPDDIKASGRASIEKGGIYGVIVDRLKADVSYSDNRLAFTKGKAQLYSGSADVSAVIKLPVVDYFSFMVNASNVESKGIFRLISWDPGIPKGRVTGEISSEGNSFNPRGNFTYTASETGVDIIGKVKSAAGIFDMQNNILRISGLNVQTGKSFADADLLFNISDNTISIVGRGNTSDLKELSAPYYNSFGGSGIFAFELRGKTDDPELIVKGTITDPVFDTHEIELPKSMQHATFSYDKSEVDLAYKKNRLNIFRFDTTGAKEKHSITGSVHLKHAAMLFDVKKPSYDINYSMQGLNVAKYAKLFKDIPAVSGTASAKGRLYGDSSDIKISADTASDNIAFMGLKPVAVSGSINYHNNVFDFTRVNAKTGSSSINASGKISTENDQFSLNASSAKLYLLDLIPPDRRAGLRTDLLNDVKLENVKLSGSGNINTPKFETTGNVSGNLLKQSSPISGSFRAFLEDNKASIDAKLLESKILIKAEASLTGSKPWTARADLSSGRYDFLVAHFVKDLPDDLLFNARGEVNAKGDRNSYSVSALLDKAHLFLYGNGFTNAAPITFRFRDNKLDIDSLRLRSNQAEVRLSGSATIGKGYDLFLEGESSLAIMKAFYKNIETLKGDGSFVFTLTGDWDRPKIYGGVELKNGTLGIKYFPYRFTGLNAYAYIDDEKVVIEKATAAIAGGNIDLSGFAYLSKFRLKKFFIESKVRGINASISKNFWALVDGDLTYKGDLNSQMILGDVKINKAKYAERLDWKSALVRFKSRTEIKTEPTPFEKTALNIRVSGNRLLIDNNVARASVNADILVRGTIGSPVLFGKAETKDGLFYFRNNDFKITTASLDFSDPSRINPFFNIAATTSSGGYNVRLNLDGYMDQFNLVLSSTPPLPESDILSLLALGQVGKNLKGLGGGIGAGEAASFMTGKLQDVLEDRAKTITGFDRVQIEPYVSKTTGTVSPRVTVSKRLLSDKLYVTYSSSVNTGEEQVWKLEYLVGRNTSLVGIRDERGAIGGDIKFRFEFK